MKIAIVGPGYMPIPPIGWGAVEILIWDLSEALRERGHDVLIINTNDKNKMLDQINLYNPDFVHIHYDDYFSIEPFIYCDNIAYTNHYGYMEQPNKYDPGYWNILNGILNLKRANIFALSQGIANCFLSYNFDPNRVFVIPNGVDVNAFDFRETSSDKSICLGKIERRKRQYLLHDIPDVFFAGEIHDERYNRNNYLGNWTKEYLYEHLTNYSNLVLLSDGEAHPLVCMEAMAAGLGLVISEYSTANLDLSLPFIDVIPEDKVNDIKYIESIIIKNRIQSSQMRNEIKLYAIENHSWPVICDKYLQTISHILLK